MKKWFPGILCCLMILFCGCGADPDLILQNADSLREEVSVSSPEDQPESRSQEGSSGQENTGSEQEETQICAYICGAVCNPGVYELEPDSRVFQLVGMAGGLTAEADEKGVNLAEVVADGQMIWIPTREESMAGQTAPAASSSGITPGSSGEGSDSQMININTASASELTALNGIGETKAEAIITYREEHGAFGTIDEIMQVDGIGQGTFDKIKDNITV